MAAGAHEITGFLRAWSQGDSSALDQLTPLVYHELHRLAARYLSVERTGHTLQPTALVHEAYMRLIAADQLDWDSRGHFYSFAARLMRQVLVDYARRHGAAKRDAGPRVPLSEATAISFSRGPDLLALDQALEELAAFDPRKSRIVELRYFAGMGVEETAHLVNLSVATVRRELRLAEAWLHRAIAGHEPAPPESSP